MWMHIVLALHELNKNNRNKVIHRGITPDNILIDENNTLKLGDFGHAKILDNDNSFVMTSMKATKYLAPEQVIQSKSSLKSDIWALGCLLYEITCLQPPFVAQNHLSLAMKIKNAKIPKITGPYSNELSRVVNYTLQKNPKDRPSVEELLNIPQISIRLRQKRLQDNQAILNKREEELQKKEKYLKRKEEELKQEKEKLKQQKLELSYRKRKIQDRQIETERQNYTLNTSKRSITKQLNNSALGNSRNFNSSLQSLESTCDQSVQKKLNMAAREEYFNRPKNFLYNKTKNPPNAFDTNNQENIHPKNLNNKREKLKSITQRYKVSTDIRAYKKLKDTITKKTKHKKPTIVTDILKLKRVNSLYTTFDQRNSKKYSQKVKPLQTTLDTKLKTTTTTFEKRLKNLTSIFEKRIKKNFKKVGGFKRISNSNVRTHQRSVERTQSYYPFDRICRSKHVSIDRKQSGLQRHQTSQHSFHYNLRSRLNSLQPSNRINFTMIKNSNLNKTKNKIKALSRQNSQIY